MRILKSIITWPEIEQQTTQAEKVYRPESRFSGPSYRVGKEVGEYSVQLYGDPMTNIDIAQLTNRNFTILGVNKFEGRS